MTRIALMCRAGFEEDLLEEIGAWMTVHGGIARTLLSQAGLVMVALEVGAQSGGAPPIPPFADLVFARDLMVVRAELTDLDTRDRLGPIEQALEPLGAARAIHVLSADSDAGKPLGPLLRALETRLSARIVATGRQEAGVWLVSGTHALIGVVPNGGAAVFPGGVARLRFPREAPSRSTLKLDEAFHVLLSEAERTRLLRAGLRAVDLGAAPGGWTFQLVRRHIRVIAVDNGRMDAALLQSGLVEHLREDGFRFRPTRAVDWLVCDMVEKPAKVVDLVLKWFQGGHCRAAVFNLKLPMKRRFEAWSQARVAFAPLLARGLSLRARQLYHDREEITVALIPDKSVKAIQTPKPEAKVQRAPNGRITRRRT
jgi:23S rRNA (cytidine2498-2'-O)-methyltransferase